MEAKHEIDALRFWDGDGTAQLLEADENHNAMLLEHCDPGTLLRDFPEPEQDVVIARLLRRLWRAPSPPHPFRPLSAMTAHWSRETRAETERWPDAGLVNEGLRLFEELPRTAPANVLLATDLPTFTSIESLEKITGIPVLTSNQTLLWSALEAVGYAIPIGGLGRLFAG